MFATLAPSNFWCCHCCFPGLLVAGYMHVLDLQMIQMVLFESLLLKCRFTNRENLDFATAQEVSAVQEFTLNEDFRGILEYPLKCGP